MLGRTLHNARVVGNTPIMFSFIEPARPRRSACPPVGENWLHEVKFDGYRIQLHKHGRTVQLLSRNGHDFSDRFPTIIVAAKAMPVRSLIIDGEVVACDQHGAPDFRALHLRKADGDAVCVWAFDLLRCNGKDLRGQPLLARKRALQQLLVRAADRRLRYSEHFDDGHKLLIAAEHMRLEGIVCKRVDTPYHSGTRADWIKIKCTSWRQRNRERWRLFERSNGS